MKSIIFILTCLSFSCFTLASTGQNGGGGIVSGQNGDVNSIGGQGAGGGIQVLSAGQDGATTINGGQDGDTCITGGSGTGGGIINIFIE